MKPSSLGNGTSVHNEYMSAQQAPAMYCKVADMGLLKLRSLIYPIGKKCGDNRQI